MDSSTSYVHARRALAGACALVCLACSKPAVSPPTSGSISVSTVTTGADPDPDGYTVVVDGVAISEVGLNESVIIADLSPGAHKLALDGIASNCTADGAEKQVGVTADQRVAAGFRIVCSQTGPVAGSGYLHVTTSTSGADVDSNGYGARVQSIQGPVTSMFLPVSGMRSIALEAGRRYVIVLEDVAPNCVMQTAASPDQVVDVTAGANASVSFSIACEPLYPALLPAGSQIAFVRGGSIHLVNSDGSGVVQLTSGPSDCAPSWSPDGRRLAFVRGCDKSAEIFTMNADGTNLVRRASGYTPSWSPDGSRLAFATMSGGSLGIYVIAADENGSAPIQVVNRPGWDGDPSWSPDGSRIAYVSDWVAYDFTYDVFAAPINGSPDAQLTNGFNFWPNLVQYFQPAWSPDGSRLAVVSCPQAYYTCDLSSIVVMNADGSNLTRSVSTRGYSRPSWSPDGSVIVFASGGTVGWVRLASGQRGFITSDGHSPAWRPSPS